MILHKKHSKTTKFITNGSFVKFDTTHIKIALKTFLDFQEKAKVGHWENISKGENKTFYKAFLVEEFKNMLKKYPIKYTMLDEKEIPFGFAFFTKNVFSEKSIDLQFGFKNNDYFLNSAMLNIFNEMLDEIRKEHGIENVYACLGQRKKQEKYVKTMLTVFNAEIVTKDTFGRLLVRFK